MPIFKRSDGTLLKKISFHRKLSLHLMKNRTQSTIFIPFHVDVTRTLEYMDELQKKLDKKISIFSVILAAIVRTFATRPQLNRFAVGHNLYQRNEIVFSFIVKKQFTDRAKETTVKMRFSPYETIFTIIDKLDAEINSARYDEEYHQNKEINTFGKIPNWILKILTGLFLKLDRHNMAPGFLIKDDPLFCSAFLTNMGSVGMKLGPHHHLFEWGNASLFLGISGHTKRAVVDENNQIVARDILDLIVTWDDRIADGFYGQKSAETMIKFIENPELLEEAPEISDDILEKLMLKDYPPGKN